MIWYAKMQPLSGNQLLELRTSLLKMPLVLRLPRKTHLCRSSSNLPRPPSFLKMLQHPHVLVTFEWMHNPPHLPHKTTSERPKCLRASVFNTFDFEMCFAPQCRALFRHLNFQQCSETASFEHFLLPNVLRATTPCTFSSSQLPKLLRTPQFLTHFTSKCASRHNAVHLFNISTSKSGPTLRCFVPFHFEIGFAPQLRATFHLSSPQMSPHPPL